MQHLHQLRLVHLRGLILSGMGKHGLLIRIPLAQHYLPRKSRLNLDGGINLPPSILGDRR